MDSSNSSYEFGPYLIAAEERVLVRDGQPVSLTPKAFDTLLVLVRNSGHLVEKDELMTAVWPDTCVEESNLTQNIFTLRRVLGETADGSKYIETVPRRGYRFVAPVREVSESACSLATATGQQYVDSQVADKTPGKSPHFLAVLPFVNVSENPKTEYLSDGITETIINILSQLPQLRVMARSAVFRYKGKDPDMQRIGRELGVNAVLVGRVHSLGRRLQISTELVDVANGWQIWGESYDRTSKDIFEVQDEIARQISAALRLKLTGEDDRRLSKRYSENIEAYYAYLRGRYYWSKYTREGLNKGIEYFRQAIHLDPTYALAYAGLADSYFRLATNYLPPKEALPKAKAAALHALAIDDNLAEAHNSMGMVNMRYDWDWEGAEREFKLAIKLNPNYSTARQWYAVYLASLGRFDEAMAQMRSALELDPLSLHIKVSSSWLLWKMHKNRFAVEELRRTIEMDPAFQPAHFVLGMVYEELRELPESISELKKAVELGETSIILGFLGRVYEGKQKPRQ